MGLLKSGTQIGSLTVRYSSGMVNIGNKGKQIKETTCFIKDIKGKVVSQATVKKFSKDQDVTDVARNYATETALSLVENKKIKKELYSWWIPLKNQIKN